MSQAVVDKVLNQLHQQVKNLIDDILNVCPEERDLLKIRLYFDLYPPIDLMDGFIKWVYPWKEQIMTKNEDFFKKNDHIFGPLPSDKVEHLKKRLYDGTFDNQDREVMWKYFQVFITLIEKYKKLI